MDGADSGDDVVLWGGPGEVLIVGVDPPGGLAVFETDVVGETAPAGEDPPEHNITCTQGCDRDKYFGSPNQIQNQIRLVLLVLPDTKIGYH